MIIYLAYFRYRAIDGTKYHSQVAFQVLIEPDCYQIGRQTVGATTQVDPIYPNSQLEWSAKGLDTNYLNGLLVRLEKTEMQ